MEILWMKCNTTKSYVFQSISPNGNMQMKKQDTNQIKHDKIPNHSRILGISPKPSWTEGKSSKDVAPKKRQIVETETFQSSMRK